MAISFVAASAVQTGSNPTVAVPTGALVNDLLLLVVTASVTPATPTGWARLAAQGSGQYITVFYKFLAPGETDASSFSLTMTSTAARSVMVAYRGASGVEVVPAVTSGTGTTMTPNTVTTTYANDFVISIYACGTGGATTLTRNASTTQRSNTSGATSTNGLLIADELQAAAGVSTARAATLSVSRAWSSLAIGIVESPRTVYWVGGNGTWDVTSSTNWSDSSGGSGGFAAPGPLDTAVINANSGSPTVTLSGQIFSGELNTTGATCTIAGTGTLTINGGYSTTDSTTWSATGLLTFTGSGTVTSTGTSINVAAPVTVNASGNTVTFAKVFSLSNAGTYQTFTLTSGTIQLNENLVPGTFSSNNTNTRSINFNGGTIRLATTTGTVWSCATATNFSTTGTPTVRLIGSVSGTRTVTHGTTGGSETTGRIDITAEGGPSDTFAITSGSHLRSLNIDSSGNYNAPSTLNLYGSFTVSSGLATYTGGTGTTINFLSTSAGNTITVNGKTTISNFTFNGVGGSWSLVDAINLGSADITVTNGTFSTNNQNITCGSFFSFNSNIRTINLGSSTITLSDTSAAWDCSTSTNLTLNAGTSQINLTSTASPVFAGGSQTYNNLNFVSGATLTISGSNTFNALSCSTTSGTATTLSLTSGTTQTVTNFNVDGSSATSYVSINASSSTAATLSKSSGTVSLSNARIGAVAATGGATWNAFGCQKRSALATGWDFGTFDRYLVGSGPSTAFINFTTTGYWSTTSGGATTAQPPYIFDTAILDGNSNYIVITMTTSSIGTLNVTNAYVALGLTNNALRMQASQIFSMYGSCTIPNGSIDTFSGSFTFSFASTSSGNIINFGSELFTGSPELTFNGIGGEWTLQSNVGDAFFGRVGTLTFTNGTLNTASYNILCLTFTSTGTNSAATLNLSGSTLTVNTALTITSATTTLNAGTSTVVINPSSATAFTFDSNKTFNTVQIGQSSATGTVTFSNTPRIQKLSSLRTGAYTISLGAAGEMFVGQFDVRGTAGNVVTVSTTSGTGSIYSLNNTRQSNIDYIAFSNVTVGSTDGINFGPSATIPLVWYVGSNSTASFTVSNDPNTIDCFIFSSDTSSTYYRLASGTTWTVPSDWNSSNNNVYLFGGGGGSAGGISVSSTGSKISGAGGGGGGFTALTNVTLTPSGTVPYAIGAAGAAGAASSSASTGTSGGTTTFNTTNTAGGGGGGTGTTTASDGGTAGTGTTNNGGAGAAGTFTSNITRAGSGGGGSGGLDGAGQAGTTGATGTAALGGAGGQGNNNVSTYLENVIRYGDGAAGANASAVTAGNSPTTYAAGAGGGSVLGGSATDSAGATGRTGVILIRYAPAVTAGTGNFLTFFYQ